VITLDQHLRPHPDVVDTELDGDETVVLHLESKLYFSLNPTGTSIWKGLKSGLSLRDISRRLQDRFTVDGAEAERCVIALAEELTEQQLVIPSPPDRDGDQAP
jgi:hypothetical protein